MNLDQILSNKQLFDEIVAQVESEQGAESAGPGARGIAPRENDASKIKEMPGSWSHESAGRQPALEAIVRATGRPVLYIREGVIDEPSLDFWKTRLAKARQALEAQIPSVGRVEVDNNPNFDWLGTGWLVAPDVVVTNRHVAGEFGLRGGDGFIFRQSPGGRRMRARLDTLEEFGRGAEMQFRLREILHIESDENGRPDIAFLKVEPESQDGDPVSEPIKLAETDPKPGQVIGAVGYAAWDGRRNPGEAMGRIFNNVFNVKRLHPGEVMESAPNPIAFNHDCSTLGGNSGSTVLDFETGEAVGLHFAGSFMERNWAVKASVVRERLKDVLDICV